MGRLEGAALQEMEGGKWGGWRKVSRRLCVEEPPGRADLGPPLRPRAGSRALSFSGQIGAGGCLCRITVGRWPGQAGSPACRARVPVQPGPCPAPSYVTLGPHKLSVRGRQALSPPPGTRCGPPGTAGQRLLPCEERRMCWGSHTLYRWGN